MAQMNGQLTALQERFYNEAAQMQNLTSTIASTSSLLVSVTDDVARIQRQLQVNVTFNGTTGNCIDTSPVTTIGGMRIFNIPLLYHTGLTVVNPEITISTAFDIDPAASNGAVIGFAVTALNGGSLALGNFTAFPPFAVFSRSYSSLGLWDLDAVNLVLYVNPGTVEGFQCVPFCVNIQY
eukprot:TRINITY_DN541_c0_g4_i1.p1 TRINITY_DN541_c0_g4~~TRINITY_DN541_c0_g4_i1.p1  ORF type:complete len:180 (-),score=24.44 TRINITY_DN541_c0_g4_i1:87-626(-)